LQSAIVFPLLHAKGENFTWSLSAQKNTAFIQIIDSLSLLPIGSKLARVTLSPAVQWLEPLPLETGKPLNKEL
jgi:hypothetical protein